jgi:hypothetical protein
MEPDDSQAYGPARLVLPIALLALLVWPITLALGSIAEIGAVALAVVALLLGARADRVEGNTKRSDLGMRVATAVVFLVIGGRYLGQGLSAA